MERLIEYFVPEHYDLDFDINKKTEKVVAQATVKGQSKGSVIKLHSKNLKIKSVVLNGVEAGFEVNENEETLTISGAEAGKTEIGFEYEFRLTHNMEGAYVSTYMYNGKQEKLVATQFESHYAREVFPCVDEPAAKATFRLSISTDDITDTVLSNMPIEDDRLKANKRKVVFEETPRMSTYLVAFVAGHLKKYDVRLSQDGVKVATYAAMNQPKSSLKFPNQFAEKVLSLYNEVFGVKYPLPKLDQVALPDFEAGAMENWGLVTYREACLLVDKNTSQSEKEYVATVIAHELSHQWFGNLVTMRWWDDLWLNESFANMMQYLATDRLYPKWSVWEDFWTSDCFHALRRDALPGVQAVQQEVRNPAEIATLFDSAIVYAKGSHLMFMLMRLMGEEKFLAGIRDYFKAHAYGNTVGDDLWGALDSYADFDVKEFMHAWISQPGYPLVTDGAQQRFLLTGATDSSKWPLPEVTDDMSGHYLLNLSADEFEEKLDGFDGLSLEQRLRLLIDRMLLAQTPLVSAGSLMDLLPKFARETSEPTWEILADIVGLLKIFCLPDTEYYGLYQKFVMGLVEFNLARLGFMPRKGEDDAETKLRLIILSFAIYAEDEKTLRELSALYDSDFSKINSEIRSAVLLSKFRYGNEEIFDELLMAYPETADPSIKSDILSTLCTCRDEEHIKKMVSLLQNPDVIRPQDHEYLLAYLLTNFYSREMALEWFYKHWDYIKSLTSDKSMDDYIRIVAARIRTREEYERFLEFVGPLEEEPALARSVDVAKTDVLARIRWIESDKEAVRKRLK